MYVAEHGPTQGVPVIFLHGAMVAGWMWLGQVEKMPEYRCLLPDFPGVGRSGDEPWMSLADTADKIAAMIHTRCDQGSAHLVGLSLGGILALNVAARHPETVRSLLISGVPQGEIPTALRTLSNVMLGLYGRPWGARLMARMFGMPDEESREAFGQTARQTHPTTLHTVMAEVNQDPLPQGLAHITAPTLAVVGDKDTAPARRAAPYLAQVMPNAAAYLVPGVGHMWNAEQPQLFTNMVRAWVDSRQVIEPLVRMTSAEWVG